METWRTTTVSDKYEVSDEGRIRTKETGLIRKLQDKGGYRTVDLHNKRFFVHRLVGLAFIGDSKLQINHKNGIKDDNSIGNLEFVTAMENCRHALATGLFHGERPYSINKEGEIVSYISVPDAVEKTGIPKRMIMKNLYCEQKSTHGLIFYREGRFPKYGFDDIEKLQSSPKGVTVKYRDGNCMSFYSIGEAERSTGKAANRIRDWCNGRVRCKTATWSFN